MKSVTITIKIPNIRLPNIPTERTMASVANIAGKATTHIKTIADKAKAEAKDAKEAFVAGYQLSKERNERNKRIIKEFQNYKREILKKNS